jgi:hypothetical protein
MGLQRLNNYIPISMKIKIISGYSGPGGSTTAFIMLTNELNKRGYDATYYGTDPYHLDKCKSAMIDNDTLRTLHPEDIVILHYLSINMRVPCKKVFFVSHETYWSEVKDLPKFFDKAIFLHEEHRAFHKDYTGDYSIIPNLKPPLASTDKPDLNLVAGIIGGIEKRKQTHRSIQRALDDGCTKILLFGKINDNEYYSTEVYPLMQDNPSIVEHVGYTELKQEMYDKIGRVYHSSLGEVACLVKDECWLTNTKFFGNSQTENEVSILTNDEVMDLWIKLFQ